MSEKRLQGRPCRGTNEVGRDKILQALRWLLRFDADFDMSRKALAIYAGVTPALISYYFPRKHQLLVEAVEPVLKEYAAELSAIVYATTDREERLRKLTRALVRLYRADSRILSVYKDLQRSHQLGESADILESMANTLDDFITEWRGKRFKTSFDAAVLQGALWGMCDFAARASESAPCESDQRDHELVGSIVALLTFDPSGSRTIMTDVSQHAVVALPAISGELLASQAHGAAA